MTNAVVVAGAVWDAVREKGRGRITNFVKALQQEIALANRDTAPDIAECPEMIGIYVFVNSTTPEIICRAGLRSP